MRIKYNRTSMISQSGLRFNDDQEKYDLVLFDKGVSGKIPFDQREKGKILIELIKSNKVTEIVTEELSRLGRSMVDVLTTLKIIEDHGVRVTVRNMGNLSSIVNGQKNPIWDLICGLTSSLYMLELESIIERTSVGRKIYVLNGGKLGRPTGTNESQKEFLDKPKNQQIKSLLEKGKSVRDISGRLGVSSRTIIKVKSFLK